MTLLLCFRNLGLTPLYELLLPLSEQAPFFFSAIFCMILRSIDVDSVRSLERTAFAGLTGAAVAACVYKTV